MKKIIKKRTPHLFIRINDFNNNDYIEEHRKVIKKNGYTWMLKMGKTINREYLKDIVTEHGGIILKSSAKRGNKFYYAEVVSTDISKENKLVFPEYYEEYFDYEYYTLEQVKKDGFWFKITNIIDVDDEFVDNFIINNGEKPMLECALETRVVHMYISNKNQLELNI